MATLAPPNSLGILLASDVQDVNGIDPLFLGFVMHVGILTTPNVIGVDLRSDSNGYAFGSIAIAGSHWLVGTTYYAQSIFAWLGDCQPSYSALSSSRGIAITFQH
jgi:hypothetical protein